MNSPDTTPQIQAIEAAIQRIEPKVGAPADSASVTIASQLMQKDHLKQDLMYQVKLHQEQVARDQQEQARLRQEMIVKDQMQQSRTQLDQVQRTQQELAKMRQEQIQKYEQQQNQLKEEQAMRNREQQTRMRQEQMQRERDVMARQRQEQIQREQQQMQARLKQEQSNREKARQEQIQKERVQQERAKQEQAQKEMLLAARLREERAQREKLNQGKKEFNQAEKKAAKAAPKTPEQLAKDEEARAFSSRTEMSLASIAFCSPLMLFGMGTAMSIFDNFSGKNKDLVALEANKKNNSRRNMELSAYAREQADKKFNDMLEGKNRENLSKAGDVNAAKNQITEKTETTSQKAEKEKEKNRFLAAPEAPVVARKNDSLEVKKLWKERQRLLEHLERVRGQGSLALVSRLVSQLETLDRSLKRLGCDPQA